MGRGTVALLCAVCLVPMLLALVVLDSGGSQRLQGTIDDAASCSGAGATYLADTDECAFTDDVVVEPGRTLVLGSGLEAFTFHRGLEVEGTLVSASDVTTPDDVVVAGDVQVRGEGAVRTVSALSARTP